MLDHMLFNLQKWFAIDDNANSVTINSNRYYKAPKQIRTAGQTIIGSYGELACYSNYIYNVVGAGNDYYLANGPLSVAGGDTTTDTFMIKKSDCTPIWGGGKALLSHLYQWFRKLYRMVVIAC